MDDRAALDGHVRRGIESLSRRRWYEAHEAFEAAWRLAEGQERSMLQGLVQLAVALEHLRRGNRKGAWSVFRRALIRLDLDERHPGLRDWIHDVVAFFGSVFSPGDEEHLDRRLPPLERWPAPRRGSRAE